METTENNKNMKVLRSPMPEGRMEISNMKNGRSVETERGNILKIIEDFYLCITRFNSENYPSGPEILIV